MTSIRQDISDRTGFDAGDRFETASQVHDYFTVANLHEMVGHAQFVTPEGEDLTPAQKTLERWAALVIEERWHCTEDFDPEA